MESTSSQESFEMVLDTGLQFQPLGGLAYCIRGEVGLLWPVCPVCQGVGPGMSPWARCSKCRTMLFRANNERRSPQDLPVDSREGRLSLSPGRTVVPCPVVPGAGGHWEVSPVSERVELPQRVPSAKTSLSGSDVPEESVERSSVAVKASNSLDVTGEEPSGERAPLLRRGTSEEPVGERASCLRDRRIMPDPPPAEERWMFEIISESDIPVGNGPEFVEGINEEPVAGCSSEAPVRAAGRGSEASVRRQVQTESAVLREAQPERDSLVALEWGLARARRSGESYLPQGRGVEKELPRLSRLQCYFNKFVALEYGWMFPYVSEELFDLLEEKRQELYEQCVWEHMGIPRPQRKLSRDNPYMSRFETVFREFKYGRHIYKNRVVLFRPGAPEVIRSVDRKDPATGQCKRYPDPRWYEL